eukprot:TRINITY_DN6702_c0_g11_i1.p1 TRINITY_DN6702_c0_g11~~TRINITY_DN6702_c0_g11_i1.p1  ORF type:complete len:633 (+),score=242.12 TRINITY_DN6702_c0_g11_i1:131-1900(+)
MAEELAELVDGAGGWSVERVYKAGMAGKNTSIRSVYWRLYTGLLSPPAEGQACTAESVLDAWEDELMAKRAMYTALKRKHEVKAKAVDDDDEEALAVDNPLSDHQDNSWNLVFKHKEIEREIRKDLERLSSEDTTVLEEKSVRESMLEVLRLASLETPDPGYRQGMHDILSAFAYYAFSERHSVVSAPAAQKKALNEDIADLLEAVVPTKIDEIEADMYYMYNWLLNDPSTNLKAWYKVLPHGGGRSRAAENGTPILQLCHDLQAKILPKRDPALAEHLEVHGIEPSLYALRWFRVWFIREFDLLGSAPLWDAVFVEVAYQRWGSPGTARPKEKFRGTYKPPPAADVDAPCPLSDGLMKYIATAMLTYLSQDLQERDFSMTLKRLMKYPPVEDVRVFVEKAVEWSGTPLAKFRPPPPQPSEILNLSNLSTASSSPPSAAPPRGAAAPTAGAAAAAPASSSKFTFGKRAKAAAPRPVGVPPPGAPSGVSPGSDGCRKQLEEIVKNEHELAAKLEGIIAAFQRQFLDQSEKTAEEKQEQYDKCMVAIAELKQVKDTLAGSIIPSPAHVHLQAQQHQPRFAPLPSLSGGYRR